ncbi:MAG: transcriptional repressor LexA, partial [bacterium]
SPTLHSNRIPDILIFGSYSVYCPTEVTKMPLTKRQKEILSHIQGFIDKNGYAPSFEEMAEAFGLSSVATVHEHISNLERKGYIRKTYNESRSIELVQKKEALGAVEIPLLGLVPAGIPTEAIAQKETITVPHYMVMSETKTFALKVEGQSMIEEQISDGDYVVVHAQSTSLDGQTVIALIDGDSATVKKFYREADGRIRLQPANPAMEPIIEEAENVQIQGIVVGVIRKYL